MTDTSISVVICAYSSERYSLLLDAVESVRRQTIRPVETIVVIDHNPELLAQARAALASEAVVENAGAPGLSAARNTGIAASKGSIVVFLDDDACADTTWLENLLASYDHPGVLGVGGSIHPVWPHGRPGWFPEEFDWVVGCTYRGMPEKPAAVRNFIGANMSFRRSVFDQVGVFRTEIGRIDTQPYGCEETEICIRVRQRFPDSSLVYQPSARVYHHVSPDRTNWRYFAARCYAEGVSKRRVARMLGAKDSLSTERSYATRTLPRAAVKGLEDLLLRGDLAGPLRTGAVLAGLAITGMGYLQTLAVDRGPERSPQPEHVVIKDHSYGR